MVDQMVGEMDVALGFQRALNSDLMKAAQKVSSMVVK